MSSLSDPPKRPDPAAADPCADALVVAAFGRRLEVRDALGHVRSAVPFGRRLDAVVGDRVRCEYDAAHNQLSAVEVLPRRTALVRSNARGGSEVVAANLDALAIVIAPLPRCDLFIVDRYLAAACSAGLDALIVLNKADLDSVDRATMGLQHYERIGTPVVRCSVLTGEGCSELNAAIAGRTLALVGQSGVGKSSLVSWLLPDAQARAGELDRDDEGRHTTTTSRLYDLRHGARLVDSPGVRDFAPSIAHLDAAHLGFAEVERLAPLCRFADCRHMQEPGCAVLEAVAADTMDERRYESYRRLRRLVQRLAAAHGPGPRRSAR
jgi:ribosome biogenesis GTPase / thiamine phosphate phosphatase